MEMNKSATERWAMLTQRSGRDPRQSLITWEQIMKKTDLNRRDFNRLSMAAFGGVVAGSLVGCGGGDDEGEEPDTSDPVESPPETTGGGTDPTPEETTEAEHDVA